MTLFLIIATLLVVAALAAVLIPLLKKTQSAGGTESSALSLLVLREHLDELDRERLADTLSPVQYEKERAEIERRVIEDGRPAAASAPAVAARRPAWLAAAISAAVVGLTVALYLQLGSPMALQPASNQGGQQQNAHAVTPQQIQAMVVKLAERLQENPADGEGWLMLARSYNALGRFPEASAAFGRATSLLPPDAQLLSDYADTLAMAQGRRLTGDPEQIIKRALEVDPRNIKALALSGSVAFERQDYSAAIGEWRKVLAVVPGDSSVAERIRTSIADAEKRSGKGPEQASGTTMPASASLKGTVSLDSALRDQVASTDTVFVFARAMTGSRMPLAIKRMTAGELPVRFSLDDSMSMPGGPKLSEHKQVVVGARISRTGNATPSPGDLEGYADPAAIGADNIRVTISRAIPR
jgi:cytochrome c-type biogenesis protein CcmH